MTEINVLRPDICIIGAGAGGLTVAAGATQLGASVVLIDASEMDGNGLNQGSIPSNALLAAASYANVGKRSETFGITYLTPSIDRSHAVKHVASAVVSIAPQDSIKRLEAMGVKVIRASASFDTPDCVTVGECQIKAKRFVIASGSQTAVPPIAGLDNVSSFTNETIFAETGVIEHLLVIGGGSTGVELAQVQRRLGAKVTLVEMVRLLPKEDDELVSFVREVLIAEGIDLRERTHIIRLEKTATRISVYLANNEGTISKITVSHILVAAGRKPTIDGLGLDKANVVLNGDAIRVDQNLRTSNSRIYAIGDCVGEPALAHVARYQGGIVLRNILFRLRTKTNPDIIPWVTFTDPELAYVGMLESSARARFKDVRVEALDFGTNDRARAQKSDAGRIKIVLRASGQILGVGIVGQQAGELLAPWCLAMGRGLKLSAMAGLLLPYPTLSEISKRVAGNYYAPRLFSTGVRALVRGLLKLP